MSRNATLAKKILISISVQVIYLLVSFIVSFIVPKFIDEYQYAYWQTYILYVGYVGVLHFGLLDGIVLRYSQYEFIISIKIISSVKERLLNEKSN